MASLLLNLAGKILEPIADIVVGKVKRHVGYIFRYKKNIKELEEEKKNLEVKMGEIREKVEKEKGQGKIAEVNVEAWASEAEKEKSEVEDLMGAKAKNENMKCLKFSCPNLCSRYRMSKQAEAKKEVLEKHIQGGNFKAITHSPSYPLELQFISTDNFMNFDSRKEFLKLIKDKLKSGDRKYNVIGVHGAGGIGKTTAVEQVGKQLKEEGVFDDVIQGVVSRDVKISDIQGQLADQLRLKFVSETERGRGGDLWNRLNNGKNNLVILDDLWGKVELKEIGIPLRKEGKGCKVVLTSRDRKVLMDMKVGQCIPVDVLSNEEAWSLFEKKVRVAFNSDEFFNVAKSVCEECRGLPVAILALGGALIEETDIRTWKVILCQLQNSSWNKIYGIDKMYASLKCSYDCLGEEEKSIMLLCCLYPEDDNIPVDFLLFHCIARRILLDIETLDQARNRIIYLVRSLKNRSLLLDGNDEDHVKMHDVIRDVVVSIAKTDEQYLVKNVTDYWRVESINENMAAISVYLNEPKEVPNELVCPQLHTLWIECKDFSFQFPDNFFSGVGELKVLELKRIHMSSTPSSLANLSKLRTLILIYCQLEEMSFLKSLKSNLEVLVIVDSHIKALPMELGELSHLQVLLLNNCYQLKLIPAGVISKLTHLEELCFPDQFDFCKEFSKRESKDIEISRATLSELTSLTRLTNLSVFIPDVTLVPDLNFGNLIRYRIAVGEHFYEHEQFKERNLKLCAITYHNKVVTLLEKAKWLHLSKVEGLKNVLLSKEGKRFLELEHFVIEDCHGLEYLLGTPDRYTRNQGLLQSYSFSKLTELTVTGCSFKFLFTSSCAKVLQQLQELEICRCDILEEIVGIEGEKDKQDHFNDRVHFSKLKKLKLKHLQKLISFGPKTKENATVEGDSLPTGQSLFNEKVAFPSLKFLDIENISGITEIWDKHVLPNESFPQLANFRVSNCEKLVNVFPYNMIPVVQNLKSIQVSNCNSVELIVSTTGVESANNETVIFPYLKKVTLVSLESLKNFCGSSSASESHHLFKPQVAFPSLVILEIWNISSITEIWDKHVLPNESFPQLVHFRVYFCEKLVNLFPHNMIPVAQNLKYIEVFSCNGVELIVSTIRVESANNETVIFPYLKAVRLTHLENLKSFCGSSSTSESHHLFKPQVIFPALEDLYIESLPSITEIWDKQVFPIKSFPHLADVKVEDCEKLVNVFPSNLWAQSLRKVSVSNCKGVAVVVSITGLEESDYANNCSIIFPQLSNVYLDNLENLYAFCGNSTGSKPQYLFGPQAIFPGLEDLYIEGLPNITEIWDKQVLPKKFFPHLANVYVEDCEKLVTVFPSNLWAQGLRMVRVGDCKGVTVIASITGLEEGADANTCSIIFPQLSFVYLHNLENLYAFCCGNFTASKPQSLFNPQVICPALEHLRIKSLPNITEIWDKQIFPINSFPHLADVEVEDCEKLATIFPSNLWA